MTVPETLRQLAAALEENDVLKARIAELEEELRITKNKVPAEEKQWLNVKEAASFIGRSETFLHQDRTIKDSNGKKIPVIPFRKDGHRSVFYHRSDLQVFIESRKGKGKQIKASERREA